MPESGCPCRGSVAGIALEKTPGSRLHAAAGRSLEQRFYPVQSASGGVREGAGLLEFQQAFIAGIDSQTPFEIGPGLAVMELIAFPLREVCIAVGDSRYTP